MADKQELNKERKTADLFYRNAKRKLENYMTNDANQEELEESKKEMTEKFEKFQKMHIEYILLLDREEENRENEHFDTKMKEHTNLLDQLEKHLEEMAIDKPEEVMERRVMSNKKEVEEKRADFQDQLKCIVVSKKKQEEYLKHLQENEVETWEETSQCKTIYGIKPDFYQKSFLGEKGLFQRATGVDDQTMASFEMIQGAGGIADQLRCFRTKPQKSGNKIGGKFGMYAGLRRSDGTGYIDVAYVVYSFEADLMGTGENKTKWLEAQAAQVQDMSNQTNEKNKEQYLTRLKMGDIDALAENFIVAKALTAFAQSNVIPKVNWMEENESKNVE